MSNNGDLKPEGPRRSSNPSPRPTRTDTHASWPAWKAGSVRRARPRKEGRRYGIAAAVAVLVAGIGAWLVFSTSREPTPGPVAEQAAPAVQAGAQPAAPVAEAASVPVVAEAASAPPAAATIVNVETDEQRAPDKSAKEAPPPAKALAKAPAGEPHPAASAAAGNAAKTDDTAQGRAETAKLVAKSTLHADKDAPSAKAKPQSAAKPARNRKGALTADDPDADLLAALLAPHPANTGKAPNPPNHGGSNRSSHSPRCGIAGRR